MAEDKNDDMFKELRAPLETAMSELEAARATQDAERIARLRVVYADARKAFHTTLVMNEIDETEPALVGIIDADAKLFQTLKEEDEAAHETMRMEAQQLMQERADAEPTKSNRGSIPRKLPRITAVNRIVLGDAANDARMLQTLYAAERMKEVKNPDVILGMMARLIAFALAIKKDPDVFNTFIPSDDHAVLHEPEVHLRSTVFTCRRLYDRFGGDLCDAAELRGKDGRDEWLNLAQRIGCGFEAAKAT